MIELGDRAKDRVTGFTGIVTGHARHMTGCDTYGLTPPVNDKGETREAQWFDETRLDVTEAGAVSLKAAKDVRSARKAGGPQDAPKPTR